MTTRLTREQLARRLAHDIPANSVVNLGIGQPTRVSNHLDPQLEIVLHTENGMLGMGPEAQPGQADPDLINAGKAAVTERPGASYFHHADSFAMMRGSHLDLCVLGAFQVSQRGDLSNWTSGAADSIPAVGGAMDLALGAKKVYVMMELQDRAGASKLVATCSYPLTAARCVSRVYTDAAVFEIRAGNLAVLELFCDTTVADLVAITRLPLTDATGAAGQLAPSRATGSTSSRSS